jgi:hypothetical protein
MWKPGQRVKINNKVYRVTKSTTWFVICEKMCDIYNIRLKGRCDPLNNLNMLCRTICCTTQPKLGGNMYLKEIPVRG